MTASKNLLSAYAIGFSKGFFRLTTKALFHAAKHKNLKGENIMNHPVDIAYTLCNMVGKYAEKNVENDLQEAIYQLKAIAENEHNFDFWRTLYETLSAIVDTFPEYGALPF